MLPNFSQTTHDSPVFKSLTVSSSNPSVSLLLFLPPLPHLRVCVCVCVRACMHVCARTRVPPCVCVCVCARMPLFIIWQRDRPSACYEHVYSWIFGALYKLPRQREYLTPFQISEPCSQNRYTESSRLPPFLTVRSQHVYHPYPPPPP